MWKLPDEGVAELIYRRHQHRRRFELARAQEIVDELREDGWVLEDRFRSTVAYPVTLPGSENVQSILVHFDEEA